MKIVLILEISNSLRKERNAIGFAKKIGAVKF